MHIAIFGAGAIGAFYGAKLQRAGNRVRYIARGAHLAAMQQHGLRIERARDPFALPTVEATEDPAQVGPVDVVLVAVKSYGLAQAAQAMAPLLGAETIVLPLLNGADIAERLQALLPEAHLLAGLTYQYAAMSAPGVVTMPDEEFRVMFGEPGGGTSPQARALQAVLRSAEVHAYLSDDVRTEVWRKYLMINCNAGVCSVVRQPLGPVLARPETRALVAGCQREVLALAQAQGIPLTEEDRLRTMQENEAAGWNATPSMLRDLQAGRPMELETLNGTAARLGHELGVPTPVNSTITAVLAPWADGAAVPPSP